MKTNANELADRLRATQIGDCGKCGGRRSSNRDDETCECDPIERAVVEAEAEKRKVEIAAQATTTLTFLLPEQKAIPLTETLARVLGCFRAGGLSAAALACEEEDCRAYVFTRADIETVRDALANVDARQVSLSQNFASALETFLSEGFPASALDIEEENCRAYVFTDVEVDAVRRVLNEADIRFTIPVVRATAAAARRDIPTCDVCNDVGCPKCANPGRFSLTGATDRTKHE
jgi:hypothetical protein